VGEFAVPIPVNNDSQQWCEVAKQWMAVADFYRLYWTAFTVCSMCNQAGQLTLYGSGLGGSTVTPRATAKTIEEGVGGSLWRGVDLASGTTAAPSTEATSTYSNLNPGVYATDWGIEGAGVISALAARGHRLFRLGFKWERIQPTLGAALDASELARLVAVADRARALGCGVVLDLHSYGGYYSDVAGTGTRASIDDGTLTQAQFEDVWSRLSTTFKNHAGVVAYGLMNEPVVTQAGFASQQLHWESISRSAVAAIRALGDTKMIAVSGYNAARLASWLTYHPYAWVPDARVWYEAHHYWGATSQFLNPINTENATSLSAGWVDPGVRGVTTGVGSAFGTRVDVGAEYQRNAR
jgi:aryl-phospho-beta-D-glucosidase BglC (GH1 family)